MADSSVNINIDAAKAANENLQSGNNKLAVAGQTITSNPFNPLCSVTPDLASAYINEFVMSLQETFEFAEKIRVALETYISELTNVDQEPPDGEDPPRGDPPGGDPPGGDPPGEETPIVPPVVPPIVEGTQIDPTIVDETEELNLTEIAGVVGSLIDMSTQKGKGIDEILADPTMADDVKAALLNSPYLTDELKELLTNADSETVRQTLNSIMKGEQPEVFDLNPLNVGIVYAYLMQIAGENGITVDELLNDPKYTALLKTTLGGFGDVVELLKGWEELDAVEYQAQLLKIYDGDGIGDIKDNAVSIVRTFVDYVAEATEIGAEELLTDTKYAEILKTATQQFAKTGVFMNAASHYSDNGMSTIVGGILTGKNPGALGMTDEEVTGFKGEIDALAKEKGVTASELLTDSKYADDVKNTLANSKNAAEVGTIYSKSESTVSQNVAKNLYNAEIKDATIATDATNTTTTPTSNTPTSTTSQVATPYETNAGSLAK